MLERKRNEGWDPNAPLKSKGAFLAGAPAPSPLPVQPAGPREVLASPDVSRPEESAQQFEYFVQAAVFADMESADDLRGELASIGVGARVSLRGSGAAKRYRVRLGPFASQSEARSVMAALEAKGMDPDIVQVPR